MVDKYNRHELLCHEIHETYVSKNKAYGDAFGDTFKEFGIISAITRMSDKWSRIKALAKGAENKVTDESIKDTLLDLANYCLMTYLEIENEKN